MNKLTSMFVVFLSLIILASNNVSSTCPNDQDIKPCTCDDEGLQCLKLENKDLARVFNAPTGYKAIRRVWIFQTNITALPSNAFGDYIIRELYLDLNHINSVAVGAFGEAAKTLQSLSLTRNELTSYPFSDLSSMKKLKQIGLGHNRLTSIPMNAFPSMNSLESIDLSHNSIGTIEADAFSSLRDLSLIDLSRNNLVTINSSSFRVHQDASKRLQISLRGNRISKIATNAFSDCRIGNIDLSRNQLKYLDELTFSPLLSNGTMIDVDGNPFSCSGCETYRWLIELDRNLLGNLLNFLCHDDTKLEDLTLDSIGCITDDIYT